MPHKEACEQADTFAVWTSAEIKKLRGLLGASAAKPVRSDEPGFTFQLSDHEIDQIAIAYFQSLERGVQDAGGYRHGVNEDNRAEVIETLAQDHAKADAVDTADTTNAPSHPDQDIRTAFHYTALRQLIDYNFVARDEVEATTKGKGRQRGRQTKPRFTDWRELAWHIDATLPYNRMAFFKSGSFNIGWTEANREASILSRAPKPHWIKRPGDLWS
ncbi:hypothetical protein CCR78_03900 [Rhodovulum imhoffii]|nr:hypothetical protein [Rhodovulum imhoffii]